MSPTTTERIFDPAAEEARLEERVTTLVAMAGAKGAQDAEAFGQRSEVIAVRFEKGDLKLTQVDEGSSLGLRVFADKKLGFASTNQAGEAALDATATDAMTLAGFSVPDDANGLPAPRALDTRPSLVTRGMTAIPIEEVVAYAQDLVGRALAVDPRVSMDQASVELTRSTVAVSSSAGVRAAESDACVSLALFGMAIDGDDVGGFDYWGENVREVGDIEAAIATTVEHFTRGVLGNLNAGTAKTYRGPVLFSPYAFFEIFLSPVISASSSIAVQRGRSALAGKLGEPIAHESLTMIDEPENRALTGAATFDREGQPARRTALVEAGKLSTYLYNSYSARVEGRESTGHAAGGARSVPGLGPHAIAVAPGTGGDREALYAALGTGLVVQRFSGTVDPASGDFSGVAKSARWVEGGREVRSLKETLISGNAFELLRSIAALSSASECLMGSALVPWALIDGVSVTAG